MGALAYKFDDGFVAVELAANDNNVIQRRYIPGAAIDERVAQVDANGGVKYIHNDRQNSVLAISDSSGNAISRRAYGTYGETDSSQISNSIAHPFGYTGRRWEADLGLYYYRARWYDPETATFLETDPIGQLDYINLYAYVGLEPGNKTDPSGLFDVSMFKEDANVDKNMIAVANAKISGAYWIGAHANSKGLLSTAPVVNGNYDWSNVERVGAHSILSKYHKGDSIILHSCHTYGSETVGKISSITGAVVYAPKGNAWVGNRGGGIYEMYAAIPNKQGKPGERTAFLANMPGGNFGDKITSITVNTNNNTTTVKYQFIELGSRIPRTYSKTF